MKKSELKQLIKEVIESTMQESSPPGFPKDLHDKIVKQYGKTPKAYATMWALHNKGNLEEVTWGGNTKDLAKSLAGKTVKKASFDEVANDLIIVFTDNTYIHIDGSLDRINFSMPK
jgi:hypothetical protein